MSSGSHLSPFDLSGVGMGFGLYRPRRPSYTFATQVQRQRSESYRYAVRKSGSDIEEPADFIEGIIQRKNRKESYIRATREGDADIELEDVKQAMRRCEEPDTPVSDAPNPPKSPIILINDQGLSDTVDDAERSLVNHSNHKEPTNDSRNGQARYSFPNSISENYIQELKEVVAKKRYSPKPDKRFEQNHIESGNPARMKVGAEFMPVTNLTDEVTDDSVFTPDHVDGHLTDEMGTLNSLDSSATQSPRKRIQLKKNLVLLCISFILIFNAFRAIQNLQSSLNSEGHLGIISMTCIHGTMCLTCLWAPLIINNFSAKWTLVIGMFSFILWIAANFFPRFYTLIPFAIIAGVGKGILWTAEASYILKLSYDYSRVTRGALEREMFRFHGIFLACFQTTHIWGNLISSVVLHTAKNGLEPDINYDVNGTDDDDFVVKKSCGVLFQCNSAPSTDVTKTTHATLWKLMGAFLALGFLAFFLILMCLDKIGAKFQPEKSGYEIVVSHIQMMFTHKTFRLLIPLLIFSGLQQAFVFSDFNQAYVTCTIGEEYIGYSMIILGLANVFSAILVAVCANIVPREVVFGIGGIVHMGVMIGLLIWIPEKKQLPVFFIVAASWGVCDAVWQTQCNTLICITCPENTDMAFANYRLLQSLGLTLGFLGGTFLCVAFKLYVLMVLLVVAIMFYVLAEYKVRQVNIDAFDGQIEVN